MTQNENVYAIWCRPEVDCDVISGRHAKSGESYVLVNFEVASSGSVQDIKQGHHHNEVTMFDGRQSVVADLRPLSVWGTWRSG